MALWTVALDSEGKRINIEEAVRHQTYSCVNCGEPMRARKGREREHHFSHGSVTQQCDHDGWLHKEIISLLMSRLLGKESLFVDTPDGELDLSDNQSCVREKKYDNWTPDILIERAGEVVFVEVCVTSPCSREKIDSGYKIVEIITSDARAIDELKTGKINTEGQFYKLKFYNFNLQKLDVNPKPLFSQIPDIVSDESERKVGYGSELSREVLKKQFKSENVPFCPQVSAFNGKHASFFVLHNDGTFEVKGNSEFCSTDLLVLGIDTFPDFALNIGKSYAWRKGLLSLEDLTNYEQHIDLEAVIKSFHIVELSPAAVSRE